MVQLLIQYALLFVGLPYRWGGDDPIDGFDCSGAVQEWLSAVGMDPPGDQTAQGLHDHFVSKGSKETAAPGALVFFGSSRTKITHVALLIDAKHMIEFGGGGSKTLTREDAAKQNAYCRIRPVSNRKDLVATLLPGYAS